jgi:hypothetical protein
MGFLKFFKSYLPIINDMASQIIEKVRNGVIYVGSTILIVAGLAQAKIRNEKLKSKKSKRRITNLL